MTIRIYDKLLAEEQEKTRQKLKLLDKVLRGEMKPPRRKAQATSWLNQSLFSNISFNPATLALTGWWRGSFSGNPWNGTTSAGVSGSHTLGGGSFPPSTGSSVNGFTPANYDGINDQSGTGGGTSTYLGTTGAFSIACLFKADTIANDGGSAASNAGLFGHSSGLGGLCVRTSGGIPQVYLNIYNGSTGVYVNPTTITTGAWYLVQAKTSGSGGTYRLRVNGGTRASQSTTHSFDGTTAQAGISSGVYYDGEIMEIMTINSQLSDANEDSILDYMRARYGLALT